MTTGEIVATVAAAVLSCCGTVAAAFKWAVGRITKSFDDMNAALRENSAKLAEYAETNRQLVGMIDKLQDWVEEHTPVDNLQIVPPAPQARAPTSAGVRPRQTPAAGVRIGSYGPMRPSTKGDD